eukprot:1152408-Pelagomonas_calceolata.AAC.4
MFGHCRAADLNFLVHGELLACVLLWWLEGAQCLHSARAERTQRLTGQSADLLGQQDRGCIIDVCVAANCREPHILGGELT